MDFYNILMPRPKSEMFLPSVNHEEMIKAALWNVDYHLGAVKHFNHEPGMSTIWEDDATLEKARRLDLQADINRFHAHLRAFFWELVATFEEMKVWATETHGRASGHLAELHKTANANWYAEVSSYRNFAHRCFLVAQGEYGVESRKLVFRSLIQARKDGGQPMVPDGLIEYRDEMHKLLDRLRQIPV
jgi:hypothetical protein